METSTAYTEDSTAYTEALSIPLKHMDAFVEAARIAVKAVNASIEILGSFDGSFHGSIHRFHGIAHSFGGSCFHKEKLSRKYKKLPRIVRSTSTKAFDGFVEASVSFR